MSSVKPLLQKVLKRISVDNMDMYESDIVISDIGQIDGM